MIERFETGWTVASVAAAQGVDGKTVRKWRDRFHAEGAAGWRIARRDRTLRLAVSKAAEAEIDGLRRQRLTGPAIARRLARPISTAGKVLRRLGLGRLKALDAPR